MFFTLTDEQIMIQTMAREFSRKVVALTAAERDRTKEFPSENLKKMDGSSLVTADTGATPDTEVRPYNIHELRIVRLGYRAAITDFALKRTRKSWKTRSDLYLCIRLSPELSLIGILP